jgi:hypothetical protein
MRVPSSFIVPIDSTDFPEEFWKMNLGSSVNNFRYKNAYAEHKHELIALGFVYGSQISKYDFVKSALLEYKEMYGNMLVPASFIVPIDSTNFPEEF